MNIWQLAVNQKGQILGYSSEIIVEQKRRLQDLGFVEGEVVECVRRLPFDGPCLFQVQNTVYALEKNIATSVLLDGILHG